MHMQEMIGYLELSDLRLGNRLPCTPVASKKREHARRIGIVLHESGWCFHKVQLCSHACHVLELWSVQPKQWREILCLS